MQTYIQSDGGFFQCLDSLLILFISYTSNKSQFNSFSSLFILDPFETLKRENERKKYAIAKKNERRSWYQESFRAVINDTVRTLTIEEICEEQQFVTSDSSPV